MRRWAAMAGVALFVTCGCGNGPGPNEQARRDAEVYVAIIRWFVVHDVEVEPDEPVSVFLDSLEPDDGVPIDVQVNVVRELDGEMRVRFIDHLDEAVDRSEEDEPVREGGILLRLGPVSRTEEPRIVVVERYLTAVEITRYRVTVELSVDGASVVGEPEPVPVAAPPG